VKDIPDEEHGGGTKGGRGGARTIEELRGTFPFPIRKRLGFPVAS
jgi:hypothetical protein